MKKYIFNEQKINNEYKYIFLCGTHYENKNKKDKRNILREFLNNKCKEYRTIILEDNFIFKKDNSRYLVYDDIHMKDLYQVEMLTNYLSDNNIIIHESISTGAETGLFLSEDSSIRKTCLLVPDEMAIEENKIGQFIKLAFMRSPNPVKVIYYYPRVEENILSNNVKYWHTFFYKDMIGANLGAQILNFLKIDNLDYGIRFARDSKKISNGYIHYCIKQQDLYIKALPRIFLCCIAAILNINDCAKEIFNAEKKELKEYINIIKQWLQIIFINTIEEKTGFIIKNCSVTAQVNIKGVYISEIIGMCLYLFQAAEFIEIVKDNDYQLNNKVEIKRKMIVYPDGSNHFFYEKYKKCIICAVETQIK